MPIYTYRCKNCSYEFEKLQKMTAHALVTCPECKQETLVRLIHGSAGMVFKGSGFYLTDYKKASSSGSGSGEASKSSPASSTTTGGSKAAESKPAPASDKSSPSADEGSSKKT